MQFLKNLNWTICLKKNTDARKNIHKVPLLKKENSTTNVVFSLQLKKKKK